MSEIHINNVMIENESKQINARSKKHPSNENFRNMTFSVSQLAELFQVSRTAVYEIEKEGILNSVIVPHGKVEKRVYTWVEHQILASRLSHRISKPIVLKTKMFGNLKGGQGKSTNAAQFSMRAAAQGIKTILIDLDPQAHATQFLGYKTKDVEDLPTIRDSIIDDIPIEKITLEVCPMLHLVPSNLNLSTLDMELVPLNHREHKIPKLVRPLRNQYDLIVFDTSPSASITNISAMLASDELCVVCVTDHTAVTGINKIFKILQSLEDDEFSNIPQIRIIPNYYDIREKMAQECLGFLRSTYGDITTTTVVRKNQDIKEAQKIGQAIWQYNRRSTGAEDFVALTAELISETESAGNA